MSTFFADTSALAKRYLIETGSSWVVSWVEPAAGNVTVIAELALVEMRSLLARRQREKTLSAQDGLRLRNDFLLHARNQYLITLLDTPIVTLAGRLADTYPLRTLDAVQLASALHAVNILNETMTFISGDKNLLAVAAAEGFMTDDPNAHP